MALIAQLKWPEDKPAHQEGGCGQLPGAKPHVSQLLAAELAVRQEDPINPPCLTLPLTCTS